MLCVCAVCMRVLYMYAVYVCVVCVLYARVLYVCSMYVCTVCVLYVCVCCVWVCFICAVCVCIYVCVFMCVLMPLLVEMSELRLIKRHGSRKVCRLYTVTKKGRNCFVVFYLQKLCLDFDPFCKQCAEQQTFLRPESLINSTGLFPTVDFSMPLKLSSFLVLIKRLDIGSRQPVCVPVHMLKKSGPLQPHVK